MKYTIIAFLGAACLISCGGRSATGQKRGNATRAKVEQVQTAEKYGYRIVKSYPHDTGSYTQGLFWHEGFLYESTGEYGRSAMMKTVPETGKAIMRTSLDSNYFGEGAALLDGMIYQLTWLEGTLFVYDAATLTRKATMSYSGEGWGLTTDGEKLYMSDGSANISVRDPATFRTERIISVRNGGTPVEEINELEWIDGKIWANLYVSDYRKMTSPKIVVIDPATGNVEKIIDFTGIYTQLKVTGRTDVMNGIAHDPATGRIFVTGKNWDKLFEIEIAGK